MEVFVLITYLHPKLSMFINVYKKNYKYSFKNF